uniref:hypothetical protein n=1 Tax=Gelidibacter sp. TaxID=2018083 RepID=UPI00404AF619
RVKVFAASTAENATSMTVNVNGNLVDTFTFNPIEDPTLASGDSYNNTITSSSSEILVTLNYNNNGNPSSQGYLDYISVEATRITK